MNYMRQAIRQGADMKAILFEEHINGNMVIGKSHLTNSSVFSALCSICNYLTFSARLF